MGVLTNPILISLSRWLETFLYNRATHLIVNSPAYRDYLINKGIPADKITFVPNGVDPTMFDPNTDGQAIRQEFDLDGQFVVTYAGALGMANDIDTILHAANDLQTREDIHFLLVGDGKERSNLEKLAQELNLKNLTFVGAKPKSEMAKFLAATDVCTATLKNIPMFSTTYPNKVFDYMAAERPTILAIDGVIRQVVEQAEGGVFVEPSNPKALSDAVVKMADNREATIAMGKSARKHVVAYFNRQDQAEVFHQGCLSLVRKQ
jgi:glycosyltransferase involved in cell wall biosynthesis